MENKWQLCVCGILRCDDEYLLIQRNPLDENMAGFWEMPSGKAEFGEKVEQSLVREIYEEIGINVSKLEKNLVGVSEYSSSKNNINKYSVQLNYLIEVPTKNLPINLSDEHVAFDWVKPDNELIDEFISQIIMDVEKVYPSISSKKVRK